MMCLVAMNFWQHKFLPNCYQHKQKQTTDSEDKNISGLGMLFITFWSFNDILGVKVKL